MRNSKASVVAVAKKTSGNPNDELALALVRSRECVMAHFRNLLRRYDLTEPQWRVLKTADEERTVELSELARMAALLMPSLSRIVRELEQRGYVTKATDPADQRRMLATLTEKGRLLVAAAAPECDAVSAAIRAAMGGAKTRRLEELLAELEQRVIALDITSILANDVGGVAIAPAKQRGRPRKTAR